MTCLTRDIAAAVAAAMFGLFVAGLSPARAEEITVRHAQGETTLPARPDTVLVYDLAALDTLDALGVEIDGVPSGAKPAYLAKYDTDAYPKVGSLFEPDYEAVNAAAPGLIIAGGRSAAKYGELSRIAPTVDLTPDSADYLGSAKANALALGRIFGKEDEAEALVARLDASTEELKARAAKAGTALAIITTGGRMSAHGPGSRFGVLYDGYGFAPAAEGLDTAVHGQPISFEFLLETNPDWLFVVDRDAAIGRPGTAAKEFLDNGIVHRMTAWETGRIVYLDPATWYLVGGGLQALQKNVDELAAALATH